MIHSLSTLKTRMCLVDHLGDKSGICLLYKAFEDARCFSLQLELTHSWSVFITPLWRK